MKREEIINRIGFNVIDEEFLGTSFIDNLVEIWDIYKEKNKK